jgi:hypothetical protein
LTIPEEVQRRQERKAQLARARAEMETRAYARFQAEQAEHTAKMAAREESAAAGKPPRGKPPEPPDPTPGPKEQYNFTDPESRIMKAGSGQHFEQAYNAQAAVEVDSRLIVGQRVCTAPNDKQQLVATVRAIVATVGPVREVLVDSGFVSEAAVRTVEIDAAGQMTGLTGRSPAAGPGRSICAEDDPPHQHGRRPYPVPITSADGRTNLRNHQRGSRIQTVLHAR